MKKIFAVNGSASSSSSNRKLIDRFTNLTKDFIEAFKKLTEVTYAAEKRHSCLSLFVIDLQINPQ